MSLEYFDIVFSHLIITLQGRQNMLDKMKKLRHRKLWWLVQEQTANTNDPPEAVCILTEPGCKVWATTLFTRPPSLMLHEFRSFQILSGPVLHYKDSQGYKDLDRCFIYWPGAPSMQLVLFIHSLFNLQLLTVHLEFCPPKNPKLRFPKLSSGLCCLGIIGYPCGRAPASTLVRHSPKPHPKHRIAPSSMTSPHPVTI